VQTILRQFSYIVVYLLCLDRPHPSDSQAAEPLLNCCCWTAAELTLWPHAALRPLVVGRHARGGTAAAVILPCSEPVSVLQTPHFPLGNAGRYWCNRDPRKGQRDGRGSREDASATTLWALGSGFPLSSVSRSVLRGSRIARPERPNPSPSGCFPARVSTLGIKDGAIMHDNCMHTSSWLLASALSRSVGFGLLTLGLNPAHPNETSRCEGSAEQARPSPPHHHEILAQPKRRSESFPGHDG